jgi:N-acyl-D-aspartate/D-glutamate deacylase
MTGMPSERLSLKTRGRIEKGLIADLAIFNPSEIIDRSTFDDPHQLSKGMIHVLVNGEPVILNEASTRAMPGKVIRRMA